MNESESEDRFPWLACASIAAAYAAALCVNLHRPWIGAHDWNGAAWSGAAHQLLQRPYSETHGGVALDHGSAPLLKDRFYVHHPSLVVWLLAAAYRTFGESEAVGRLVPIAFSGVGAFATAGLLFSISGRAAAVCGMLAFVLLPSQLYYGRMPNHEPLGLPMMLLASWAAVRWSRVPRWSTALVCAAPIAVACMSCWPAYFFAAALGIGSLAVHAPRKLSLFLSCAGASTGVLVALLLHAKSVRTDAFENLLAQFGVRSSGGWSLEVAGTLLAHQLKLLTPLGVAAVAFVVFGGLPIRAGRVRSRTTRAMVLWPLFLAALGNIVLFRQGATIHEYYCYYLGGVSAVAVGLLAAAAWLSGILDSRRLVAVVLLGQLCYGVYVDSTLHAQQSVFCATGLRESDQFVRSLGAAIRKEFASNETVLVNTLPHGPHLGYYADRRLYHTTEDFNELDAALRRRMPSESAEKTAEKELRRLDGAFIEVGAPGASEWLEYLKSRGGRTRGPDVVIEEHRFRVLDLPREPR